MAISSLGSNALDRESAGFVVNRNDEQSLLPAFRNRVDPFQHHFADSLNAMLQPDW